MDNQNQQSFEQKFNAATNTADTTSEFDPNDINQNKIMAILAYFGILVVIPILAAKESKFARFHANQGLVLFIASVAYWIMLEIIWASWELSTQQPARPRCCPSSANSDC